MSYDFGDTHGWSYGQTGWECPKCGRVFAPWMPSCDFCGKGKTVTKTSCIGTFGADHAEIKANKDGSITTARNEDTPEKKK